MQFDEKIAAASSARKSRIVLALDLEDADSERLAKRSSEVLEDVKDYVCAVKINRQLILSLGLRGVAESVLKLADQYSLPTIMDAKLNDVGHTNGFMARTYFDFGFDAIIASPVVGWEGGLDTVFEAARSRGKAVILLTYMSNPGAETFYALSAKQPDGGAKPLFEVFTDLAMEWQADGVIVGATKPAIISRVRQLVGPSLSIFSPGVGAQGGDPKRTILAGATYLIVGRTIYGSPDCREAAKHVLKASATDEGSTL